jgi:hypothetical protein
MLTSEVLLTGVVENAVGIEGFLDRRLMRSGQQLSLSPRLATEIEPIPEWLQVRAGFYFEPTRFATNSDGGRGHATLGLDVKVLPWDGLRHLPGRQLVPRRRLARRGARLHQLGLRARGLALTARRVGLAGAGRPARFVSWRAEARDAHRTVAGVGGSLRVGGAARATLALRAQRSRIELELPAKRATPRGRVKSATGTLDVDLDDLSRTRGSVSVSLEDLELLAADGAPDRTYTERHSNGSSLGPRSAGETRHGAEPDVQHHGTRRGSRRAPRDRPHSTP